MNEHFSASWSRLLIAVSVGSTALLMGIGWLLRGDGPWSLAPLALLGGAALFTIRGYSLEGRDLLVRRLLWSTRVPLDGVRSVEVDPAAMARSLRLFGNGGMFSISGLFRNRKLKTYRAWVTQPADAVVLKGERRPMVVSPSEPQRFAERLREVVGDASRGSLPS